MYLRTWHTEKNPASPKIYQCQNKNLQLDPIRSHMNPVNMTIIKWSKIQFTQSKRLTLEMLPRMKKGTETTRNILLSAQTHLFVSAACYSYYSHAIGLESLHSSVWHSHCSHFVFRANSEPTLHSSDSGVINIVHKAPFSVLTQVEGKRTKRWTVRSGDPWFQGTLLCQKGQYISGQNIIVGIRGRGMRMKTRKL
jgi:hypothetical protein